MIVCGNCGMHQNLLVLAQAFYKLDPYGGDLGENTEELYVPPEKESNWCEDCETHSEFIDREHPVYHEGECEIWFEFIDWDIELLPIKEVISEDPLRARLTHSPSPADLMLFLEEYHGLHLPKITIRKNGLKATVERDSDGDVP